MSNVPPWTNVPGQPSGEAPQYVGYQRPNTPSGNPEQLRAIADSYRAFTWTFLINIVVLLGSSFLFGFFGAMFELNTATTGSLFLTPYVLTAIVMVFVSMKASRLYWIGMGKSPSNAIITSLVLGIQAVLCCGAAGYAILQSRLAAELKKKYSISVGFLGPRKEDVEAALARMQMAAPPPPGPVIPGAGSP